MTLEKNKKRKRFIIIFLIIMAVIILVRVASAFTGGGALDESKPINVKTDTVKLNSIYATAPLSGRIEPIEEVVIVPQAAGEIISVSVSLGDKVSKGTILLKIDGTQTASSYNQAKEGYNAAKSSYDRMTVLYNEGAISLQDYEQVKTQYINAKESLNSVGDALNNCTVTSPIDGYITSLNAAKGSLASQGGSVATVADVSSLKISTTVSEYLIGEIKVGDEVKIKVSSVGDDLFDGSISAVSPAPAAGSLTYPISISVNDPSGKVKAGMFAEIQIISDEKEKVLCIPSDSVIVKSGESIVAVLDGDIPSYKKVETGLDNGEFVEIKSGLKKGETIVISGQQYIKEGTAVNIVGEESKK